MSIPALEPFDLDQAVQALPIGVEMSADEALARLSPDRELAEGFLHSLASFGLVHLTGDPRAERRVRRVEKTIRATSSQPDVGRPEPGYENPEYGPWRDATRAVVDERLRELGLI